MINYRCDYFEQIIENSEAASLKAWDDVLKHDELVEMMQLGEVFYGFREMLPRFPPTYKRKLNEAGECGDYTRYDDLVRGYSHTGEDKEVRVCRGWMRLFFILCMLVLFYKFACGVI